MANKIDLDTIAKEYAEGRISKEDFLYLHKMLTSLPGKKKPAAPQPPVLKPVQPVNTPPRQARKPVTPAHQPVRKKPTHSQSAPPRRTIRPQAAQSVVETHRVEAHRDAHIPESPNFNQPPPPFLMEERKTSAFGYIRKHHKEVVALLGTAGIFISMFYNNFHSPSVDSGNARVVVIQSQSGKTLSTQGLRTQDIKLIAELMMEDNSWNKELIDDFLAQWKHLSESEKQTVKQSDWFGKFSAILSQQIKIAQSKAKTGDVSAIYNQQALLQLADNLIFGDNKEAHDTLQKLAGSDIERRPSEPEKAAKKAPKQEPVSNTAKPAQTTTSQPIQTAKITDKQQASQPKSVEKNTGDKSEASRHRISRQEIEDVINRFTVAFEAGHSQDLMALFPDDDYSSSYAALERVKKDYKEVFRTTRDRRLDLSSFFWEHDFDEARGTARYKADLRKNNSTGETVTANLDITLRRLLGKVYITSFKLSDQEIIAHTVTTKPSIAKQQEVRQPAITNVSVKERPKHPTPAELQDLVTQYITAYETGDVKELMHLFANATWTSGRSGLVEMKQNYQSLFATTSGREIFVKDIDWDFKDKKAMGTGELTLIHHTKDKQVVSQKGKIRIVATRHGDQVRFTQMFHIVE
jgi:hypothetical protein